MIIVNIYVENLIIGTLDKFAVRSNINIMLGSGPRRPHHRGVYARGQNKIMVE